MAMEIKDMSKTYEVMTIAYSSEIQFNYNMIYFQAAIKTSLAKKSSEPITKAVGASNR